MGDVGCFEIATGSDLIKNPAILDVVAVKMIVV